MSRTMNKTTTETTSPQTSRLLDTLTLLHLFNGVSSGLGVIAGYTITVWHHRLSFDYSAMLLAALATTLISTGGFVINDILDLDIDRINRPDRPLAAGKVSLQTAWALCLGCTLAGMVLAFMVSLAAGLVATFIALGLFLYSYDLKRRFLTGHLTIAAMGAALLPFGAVVAGEITPVIYSALFVFPAFFAREVLKTVPDYEGDRAAGITNLATRYSPQTALRVARGALLLVALALPLVTVLWPLNTAYMVLVVGLLWPATFYVLVTATVENVRRASQLSKLLFLLTTLALLVGSLPHL